MRDDLYHHLFAHWPARGRSAHGNSWHEDIKNRFLQASEAQLTALTLRQAFYYSYLKQRLHKSLADPYDVDLFIAGFRGTVLPVEVNGMSVIRQVHADQQRSFVDGVILCYPILSWVVAGTYRLAEEACLAV